MKSDVFGNDKFITVTALLCKNKAYLYCVDDNKRLNQGKETTPQFIKSNLVKIIIYFLLEYYK